MRILFICTGNAYRSPLAEALTRQFHPSLEVESAGIDSVGKVADQTRRQARELDAEEYIKPSPDQVSKRAVEEADRIVCMMPRHREYLQENFDVEEDKIQVWDVEDPINPEVDEEESFDKIREKVENLKQKP